MSATSGTEASATVAEDAPVLPPELLEADPPLLRVPPLAEIPPPDPPPPSRKPPLLLVCPPELVPPDALELVPATAPPVWLVVLDPV